MRIGAIAVIAANAIVGRSLKAVVARERSCLIDISTVIAARVAWLDTLG